VKCAAFPVNQASVTVRGWRRIIHIAAGLASLSILKPTSVPFSCTGMQTSTSPEREEILMTSTTHAGLSSQVGNRGQGSKNPRVTGDVLDSRLFLRVEWTGSHQWVVWKITQMAPGNQLLQPRV